MKLTETHQGSCLEARQMQGPSIAPRLPRNSENVITKANQVNADNAEAGHTRRQNIVRFSRAQDLSAEVESKMEETMPEREELQLDKLRATIVPLQSSNALMESGELRAVKPLAERKPPLQTTLDTLASIPGELKNLSSWVVWKYKNRDGKPTKVPHQARNGCLADVSNPSTWCDYATALDARSKYEGIGCVVGPPYCCIDLDKCRNPEIGQIEEWAAAIIREVSSYTELSPSGSGFHIWVRGTLPGGRRRAGRVEIYDSARYFTVTGEHVLGTPKTIQARDLRSLQSRIQSLDPKNRKAPQTTEAGKRSQCSSKYDELMAGRWHEQYKSQSEADEALCVLMARRHGADYETIEAEFGKSRLADRDKWRKRLDYRKSTIERAIQLVDKDQPSVLVETDDTPELELKSLPPVYPSELLDGDFVGELTQLLTKGTPIPPPFVRENIKTILGAIVDGLVGFPGHQDLHTRQYTLNISLHPRTGKGESWKRTGACLTGVLTDLLAEHHIVVVDGGLFGSGEYLVKTLAECVPDAHHGDPHRRSDVLARFDEMAEPLEKARTTGSTLESKLLQLYERNQVAQGSFKNGQYVVKDIHFSLSGDFTRDSFHTSFTGRGSRGSGFLSRCTYSYAGKTPHSGDWENVDQIAESTVLANITQCLRRLQASEGRFVPSETEAVKKLRWEFLQTLESEDPRYTPELEAHFKRDLLMRVLFSGDPRIDEQRLQKAIAWLLHQLEIRKLLWPEDAGSPVERMEQRILRALRSKPLSVTRLIDCCNVSRPGSGGRDVFNRALKALIASHDVEVIGKTQRGKPVYACSSNSPVNSTVESEFAPERLSPNIHAGLSGEEQVNSQTVP